MAKSQEKLEMMVIGHITTNMEDANLARMRGVSPDSFVHTPKGEKFSLTKALFSLAMRYFQNHARLLTPEALKIYAKQQGHSMKMGGLGEKLHTLLVQCQALPIKSHSFPAILDDLREKTLTRSLQEMGDIIKYHIHHNSAKRAYEEAHNFLVEQRREASDDDASATLCNITENYQELWDNYIDRKENPDKYKGITVGWNKLDEATGGFKHHTLNLVIGEVNTGKSTMLLNMARGVHQTGKNVIFFSFEMPVWQVQARYVASRLGIPYDGYVQGDLGEEEEDRLRTWFDDSDGKAQFKKQELESGAYFAIVDQPTDTSPAFIEMTVKQYMRTHGQPHAIFIDYLGIMRCDTLGKNVSWWEHTGEAAKGVRRIARLYNLVAFSAQQTNRKGLEWSRKGPEGDELTAKVRPEHIEGWKEIINTADSAIGFTSEPENKRIIVYRIKGRDWDVDAFVLKWIPEMSLIEDDSGLDDVLTRTVNSAGYSTAQQTMPGQMSALQHDIEDELDDHDFDFGGDGWT